MGLGLGVCVSREHDIGEKLRANSRVGGGHISLLLAGAHDQDRDFGRHYRRDSLVKIGEGGFGQVYKVTHVETEKPRAVKVVTTLGADKAQVALEIESLLRLDHPNVCKIYEWFEKERVAYLVTQFIDGKVLSHFCGAGYQPLFRQLLQGIAYCHNKGVVHRDLKMNNCLVREPLDRQDERLLKIIDFGIAAISRKERNGRWLQGKIGTPKYMCPEVIQGAVYDQKCDIWSAGVIFYLLATGEYPFDHHNPQGLYEKIMEERYQYRPLKGVEVEERELIALMLTKDPAARPDAQDLLARELPKQSPLSPRIAGSTPARLLGRALCFGLETDRFERMLMTVVARLAPSEELARIRWAFTRLDRDGTGWISKAELRGAFDGLGWTGTGDGASRARVSEERIDATFDAINADGSTGIEYTQWIAATLGPDFIASKEAAGAAFAFLCGSDTSSVSLDDIARVVNDREVAAEAIRRWDKDGDRMLSRGELWGVMRSIAEGRRQKMQREVAQGALVGFSICIDDSEPTPARGEACCGCYAGA